MEGNKVNELEGYLLLRYQFLWFYLALNRVSIKIH